MKMSQADFEDEAAVYEAELAVARDAADQLKAQGDELQAVKQCVNALPLSLDAAREIAETIYLLQND